MSKEEIVSIREFLIGWILTFLLCCLQLQILIKEIISKDIFVSFLVCALLAYPAFMAAFSDIVLSMVASIIYAFLPYHIFVDNDNILGYSLVPIVLIGFIKTAVKKVGIKTDGIVVKYLLSIGAIQAALILIGVFSQDYAIIIALLYLMLLIYLLVYDKCNVLTTGLSSFVLFCTIIITNLISNYLIEKEYTLADDVTLDQIASKGIYLWKMLSPVYGHRIEFLNKITSDVYMITGNIGWENALGFATAAGLLISLYMVVSLDLVPSRELRCCGIINMFLLILCSASGFGILLSAFGVSIIKYNRAIPIIAFTSLLTVFYLIKNLKLLLNKKNDKIYIFLFDIGMFGVLLLALFDQFPNL
ncbi:MAG: hypothetical protein QM697_00470 [Lachnospiraceae bacterium]